MEDNLHIADLISAYLLDRLTSAEEKELNDWLNLNEKNQELFDQIVNEQKLESSLELLKSFDSAAALEKIKQHPQLQPIKGKVSYIRWTRIAAAASILLILSAGGYFLLHKQPAQQIVQNKPIPNDILPGANKPILTLANGQRIILSGVKNGQLAIQGNTAITKTTNGQLVYKTGTFITSNTPALYNTVTNPRGSEAVHIILSDGTDAWLNAASSITYQTAFTGRERRVTITGEVLVKVKYSQDKPFYLVANGQITKDMGTMFDVKAYPDEPAIKTSLLEGSVQVTKNGKSVVLKPGQQSVIKPDGTSFTVKEGDMEEAAAWKNGYFIFNDEKIEDIMLDISRWYDVDVSYLGDMKGKEFVGSVSRFKNVSEVLRKLEETGTIHFKIEGRRILVMP